MTNVVLEITMGRNAIIVGSMAEKWTRFSNLYYDDSFPPSNSKAQL